MTPCDVYVVQTWTCWRVQVTHVNMAAYAMKSVMDHTAVAALPFSPALTVRLVRHHPCHYHILIRKQNDVVA